MTDEDKNEIKRVGRPRQRKGLKKICSIRIADEDKEKIVEKYQSVQIWVDEKIEGENETA
jgi:hypothetical protein